MCGLLSAPLTSACTSHSVRDTARGWRCLFPSELIYFSIKHPASWRWNEHVLRTSASGAERAGQLRQAAVRMSSATCRGVARALDSDGQMTDWSVLGMLAKPLASSHCFCGKWNQHYLITSYEVQRDFEVLRLTTDEAKKNIVGITAGERGKTKQEVVLHFCEVTENS